MESPQRTVPFGKYELIEKVASGGMAEVFRACTRGEAGFEKFLAIKRILPHLSRDSEFVVMLIDEAKIAVTLGHANVVQIYDLGKAEGTYYIAMEFVEGADLKAVLQRALSRGTPIPTALAVFLIMEVLKGLEYAHQKKVMSKDTSMDLQIIHRDISPPNILISYEGEVKIVDFGIAKANTRMMETSAGVLKGKFEYMSPEQAAGLHLDQRTDIFSAGLCLYEAMTGVNPFSAASDLQVIQNVRAGRFPPASELNPRIPRRLDQILSRAMAREKEERYQSATEFRNDLAHAAYEAGLIATSPKLAAYMKALFAEDLAAGRAFVSGASIAEEAERRNLAPDRAGRSSSPYHVASEVDGGWSDPADFDPHTVIRFNPLQDQPEADSRPPAPRQPARGAPRRPPQESAPPRRPPDGPRTGPGSLEDLSADATFLAPTPQPPVRAQSPRTAPAAGGRPAQRPPPRRPPAPPAAALDDEDEALGATFLGSAPSPSAAQSSEGTDAFQTLRDMQPPALEEVQTDPRGRRPVGGADDEDDEGGPTTVTEAAAPTTFQPAPTAPPMLADERGPRRVADPTVSSVMPPPSPPTVSAAMPPPRAVGGAPTVATPVPHRQVETDPVLSAPRPPGETTDVRAPPPRLGPGQHFDPMGGAYDQQGASDWDQGYDDAPQVSQVAPTAPGEAPFPSVRETWRTHLAALMIGLAVGVIATGAVIALFSGETSPPAEDAPMGETAEVVITAPNQSITLINGQEAGRTYPLTLAVPAGASHNLEVQVAGHMPFRQELNLPAGATRVIDVTIVTAKPAPGSAEDGDPASP